MQQLSELDLLNAYTLKPLLDGKALAKALDTPPGPWMKEALDVVMAWQLRNPGVTDSQEAIEAVRKSREGGINGGELTSALVLHFLKLTIRPLFAKARPSNVTDTGRKVTTTQLPPKMTTESMDDSVNKPWKSSKNDHALDLLRWVVGVMSEELVEEVWHLVVPPVLTLIDDWEAQYKRLGVQLLREVLEVTPPLLLKRTGLGDVFEDALMPCLTYMPPVTPEQQSVELLVEVYPALITLSRIRYPPTSPDTPNDPGRHRIKFLDSITRKGTINGLAHNSEHADLIAALSDQLVILLDELNIESVKHLQYILPLMTDILSRPQSTARPRMLISTTKAMQSLIRNAAPRMARYQGEVLKGLTFCWLNLEKGEEGDEVVRLRTELRLAVDILRTAVKDDVDFDADCKQLVSVDGRLGGLFVF